MSLKRSRRTPALRRKASGRKVSGRKASGRKAAGSGKGAVRGIGSRAGAARRKRMLRSPHGRRSPLAGQTYNSGFDQGYDHGFNAGFAKGFEDGLESEYAKV